MTNREWILNKTGLPSSLSDDELADKYCDSIIDYCDDCEFIATCIPFDSELKEFMEEEKID